jgi:hypothetical protein
VLYACEGAHTLFIGQREREGARVSERKRNREGEREIKRKRKRKR